MNAIKMQNARMVERLGPILGAPVLRWVALLGLCAAYLQGGFDKAAHFSSAIAEMKHFGLSPAAPLAVATIVMEIVASILILTGFYRWLGDWRLRASPSLLPSSLTAFGKWHLRTASWLPIRSSNISASSGDSCLSPGTTCVNEVMRQIRSLRRD